MTTSNAKNNMCEEIVFLTDLCGIKSTDAIAARLSIVPDTVARYRRHLAAHPEITARAWRPYLPGFEAELEAEADASESAAARRRARRRATDKRKLRRSRRRSRRRQQAAA